MTFQARQGAVLVQQVPARKPAGIRVSTDDRVILAVERVTGHAHRVIAVDRISDDRPAAQLFEEPDGRRFLFVERACVMRHDEHEPIVVAPGTYSVTIQREYDPEGIRRVAD